MKSKEKTLITNVPYFTMCDGLHGHIMVYSYPDEKYVPMPSVTNKVIALAHIAALDAFAKVSSAEIETLRDLVLGSPLPYGGYMSLLDRCEDVLKLVVFVKTHWLCEGVDISEEDLLKAVEHYRNSTLH